MVMMVPENLFSPGENGIYTDEKFAKVTKPQTSDNVRRGTCF
jgi:hypothetical protein